MNDHMQGIHSSSPTRVYVSPVGGTHVKSDQEMVQEYGTDWDRESASNSHDIPVGRLRQPGRDLNIVAVLTVGYYHVKGNRILFDFFADTTMTEKEQRQYVKQKLKL